MIYVIYLFGGLFILLSLPMLYVFYREKHFGTFLMGVIYGLSGLLAIALPHWWPLLTGFVMAWLLRLLGLEPGMPVPGDGRAEKDEGGRMKDEESKT